MRPVKILGRDISAKKNFSSIGAFQRRVMTRNEKKTGKQKTASSPNWADEPLYKG
jgi:hypothetical protein